LKNTREKLVDHLLFPDERDLGSSQQSKRTERLRDLGCSQQSPKTSGIAELPKMENKPYIKPGILWELPQREKHTETNLLTAFWFLTREVSEAHSKHHLLSK